MSSLSNTNNVAQIVYAIIESLATVSTLIFFILRSQRKLDKRLDRIEYALWNDGQTGLVQESVRQAEKIDLLVEKQSGIIATVEGLKVRRARA